MSKDNKGLYNKYIIEKASGNPIDKDAKYFVLRYDTDIHAIKALITYAESIKKSNYKFYTDILKEVRGVVKKKIISAELIDKEQLNVIIEAINKVERMNDYKSAAKW